MYKKRVCCRRHEHHSWCLSYALLLLDDLVRIGVHNVWIPVCLFVCVCVLDSTSSSSPHPPEGSAFIMIGLMGCVCQWASKHKGTRTAQAQKHKQQQQQFDVTRTHLTDYNDKCIMHLLVNACASTRFYVYACAIVWVCLSCTDNNARTYKHSTMGFVRALLSNIL